MSYKKLVIWQMARRPVIDIHKMTLQKLPKFEMYEEDASRISFDPLSCIGVCRQAGSPHPVS